MSSDSCEFMTFNNVTHTGAIHYPTQLETPVQKIFNSKKLNKLKLTTAQRTSGVIVPVPNLKVTYEHWY